MKAIEPLVARGYKEIRKAQVPLPPSTVPKAKEWRQAIDANAGSKRLARLAYNQQRYAQVIDLQLRGVKQEEIASRLGISKRTLQRWIEQGACPGSARRRKRRSIFDPYAPYVLACWQQGCRDVSLLWQEIRDLCQPSQELETLHALVQSFGQIVRMREGHRLEAWMKQVADSGLADVQRFAKGLERDKEAVLVRIVDENRRMQKVCFAAPYAQQGVCPSQISEDRFRRASEPEGTFRHHSSYIRKILYWPTVLI